MHINEISKEIFENNKAKGFWNGQKNVGEMLMLIVSELAEALEADRKDHYADMALAIGTDTPDLWKAEFEKCIKNSFEDELADVAIRLFDICHGLGIDLEYYIKMKHEYNKMRPFKHGKKY